MCLTSPPFKGRPASPGLATAFSLSQIRQTAPYTVGRVSPAACAHPRPGTHVACQRFLQPDRGRLSIREGLSACYTTSTMGQALLCRLVVRMRVKRPRATSRGIHLWRTGRPWRIEYAHLGDVCSLESQREKRNTLGIQIADRSVQLEESVPTKWIDVQLDGLNDLIAETTVALVESGTPRDLLDIFAVCKAKIAIPQECWQLWHLRQERSGGSTSRSRATLAITTSLSPRIAATLAQHRKSTAKRRSGKNQKLVQG